MANDSNDHLLEALQKVTITIPFIDIIELIAPYVNFLKAYAHPIETPKGSNLVKQWFQSWWIPYLLKKEIWEHPWSWVKSKEWLLLDPC